MYNKIFTKILDSSIWLEPTPTRIVWLTLIAAMDEDGFAQFASIANLAHRAVVSPDDAQVAVETLEAPDPNSSDPEHEGRRVERVPGGWMVLNATKYRDMVTRIASKERTRIRVAEHRQRKREACNADVTPSNDVSQNRNAAVMQSDTDTDTDTKNNTGAKPRQPRAPRSVDSRAHHPAIQAIQSVARRLPDKAIWDEMIQTLGDAPDRALLGRCFAEWVGRGYKPLNYLGWVGWYQTGIPPRESPKKAIPGINAGGRGFVQ